MVETVFSQTDIMNPVVVQAVVSKSDTVDFTVVARGIYVGGTGNVAIVTLDDNAETWVGVPAGTLIPIVCKRAAYLRPFAGRPRFRSSPNALVSSSEALRSTSSWPRPVGLLTREWQLSVRSVDRIPRKLSCP